MVKGFMGKGEKRIEEYKEHKSREKEIVISPQDILKALNKLTKILRSSVPEELTLAKTKVAVEKEKIEQEIAEDVQKAKKIAHLNLQIEDIKKVIEKFHKQGVQDLEAIMKPFKPTKEDIQEMEADNTKGKRISSKTRRAADIKESKF
jgi:hypothetical protein